MGFADAVSQDYEKGKDTMALDKINELLEKLSDPKVQEALKGLVAPTNEEEAVRYIAGAAKQLDVDLTEEEAREVVAEAVQAQKEATEAAAGTLQQVDDEDLEAVAGGGSFCKLAKIVI